MIRVVMGHLENKNPQCYEVFLKGIILELLSSPRKEKCIFLYYVTNKSLNPTQAIAISVHLWLAKSRNPNKI